PGALHAVAGRGGLVLRSELAAAARPRKTGQAKAVSGCQQSPVHVEGTDCASRGDALGRAHADWRLNIEGSVFHAACEPSLPLSGRDGLSESVGLPDIWTRQSDVKRMPGRRLKLD